MQVQSVIEQMLFTTVRITSSNAGGSTMGTGFFFGVSNPEGQSTDLFIVTNKHVVQDPDWVEISMIGGKDGSPLLGQGRVVRLDGPSAKFVGHPDPSIDIALLPFGGRLDYLRSVGQEVFFKMIEADLCADAQKLEAYEPIEPVTFIGYPRGLFDSASLLPIVRRGHSATALAVDYEGKPVFLIDASVFPGSSGSPVFLVSSPSTPDKRGNIVIGGSARILFLGVVAQVYHREVPVLASAPAPFVQELINLGVVYKASAVLELAQIVKASNNPAEV